MQCAVRPWADHATLRFFWEPLSSQHVCGGTVPTRYDSYLKNSLGDLNITFLFLERFRLQETNLARPSGDVLLLMLWTWRWHAGLGASQKHKDTRSRGFPPLFADVTPLLHYPRWTLHLVSWVLVGLFQLYFSYRFFNWTASRNMIMFAR
jgi:hypothetical protein